MSRRKGLLVAAAGLLLLILTQVDSLLMAAMRGVGYTVCHQIPGHSIFVAGQQLPLCARCTGIFQGFLVGLLGLALLGRIGASRLPPRRVVAVLLLSLVVMGVDGLNSLLGLFPGSPQAYQPTNLGRLATGTAAGVSLALLLIPLLNDALWAKADPSESAADLGELAGYGILAALAVMVVDSAQPLLLYPTALASVAGVLVTLSAAGAILAAALLRRERRAASRGEALPVLLAGFALAGIAMLAVGVGRSHLSSLLGT